MKRFLLLVFCIVLAVSLVACGSTSSPKSETVENQVVEKPPVEEAIDEDAPAEEVIEEPQYADDEVVNDFIKAYNEISDSAFSDISKGNIKTKYFAYSYDYYCELLHANDTGKIVITINETNETAEIGTAGMGDIFFYASKCIDASLSDDEIRDFFQSLIDDPHGIDYELGNMKIKYIKDAELSTGHSRGHMEISAQ